MMINSNEQTEIKTFLMSQNLTSQQLLLELEDHFISKVEDLMKCDDMSFEKAFQSAQEKICPDGAREIEDDIHYLLTLKKYKMLHKIVFSLGALGGLNVLISIALGIGGILEMETTRLMIMSGILLIAVVVYPYLMYTWYKKSRKRLHEEIA